MGRKKKKHEEEESEERWLLTYADMITLLVAFFMMMYSMSVINLEKFKKAAIGIRSGFNGQINDGKKGNAGDSIISTGQPDSFIPKPIIAIVPGKAVDKKKKKEGKKARKKNLPVGTVKGDKGKGAGKGAGITKLTPAQERAKRVGELKDRINKELGPLAGKNQAAQVIAESKGVAIELIGNMIFFPRDSAKLSDEAKVILDGVIQVLGSLTNEISVEGHTSKYEKWDDSPFANSWELSTARAMAVITYFMDSNKIQPQRISVTGYGQYRPLDKSGDKKNAEALSEKEPFPNDRVRVFIYQD